MPQNNKSTQTWIIAGVVLLGILVVIFGWRITSVSIPVGPIQVGVENPSAHEQSQPQNPSQPQQDPVQANSAPTATSLPAPEVDFNPALTLPFYDDFDDGPDPQWRVSGSPLISQGALASSDTVTLEIGNNSLSTYMVEFDIISTSEFCSWSYYDFLVIGVTPTLQYRAQYTDLSSRGRWYALENGEWKEILRDEVGVVSNNSCVNRVRVTVNGNSYKIYANGSLTSELIYGSSAGAPFTIGTNKIPLIDNLSISAP
jgi:hypothetical protein